VSGWIANARMYAVTAAAEAAWQELLDHVSRDAGVALRYERYPAPLPLEPLWSRDDLGAVFMCGFPVALGLAPVVPIAAPIPSAAWAGGRAVYRSNLIVRRDAPYRVLEDSFGARAGYTVAHSQSGFNAFRHHLLKYRSAARRNLYTSMTGNLVTARAVLEAVLAGHIDIGPLDAYWHLLLERHAPEMTAGVRVLATTELTPIPAFVAASAAPAGMVAALSEAFRSAASQPWFEALRDPLQIEGFAAATAANYVPYLEWDREAKAAGYELPA
jgi:ABC-type phosphate/phosphonate transport system substrate-binding protein